jgi:hypothetical protein
MGDCTSRPSPFEDIPPAALEAFRLPGQTHLSPMRFREFFIVGISELERILGTPLWLIRTEPGDPRIQLRLLPFLRVYAGLMDLGLDPIRAGFHMRNTPIGTFGHRTLFEVVRDGQTDAALGYLESISSGFVGLTCPQS